MWEKEVFEKLATEYNSKPRSYYEDKDLQPLIVNRLAERAVTDQLKLMNSQNISVVVISYLLMFAYISICMGEFSLTKSRIVLALGGILVVLLSFGGSVSLVSLIGIKLSIISAEVVPFLILAIGVDNMFIITNTKDRIARGYNIIAIPKLIGITIGEAGPSITVASLSEFLAFLVGYMTNIPALQSFCLAAAFAILIDYILQMTLFLAFVALDEERSSKGYMDVFCCFKVKKTKVVSDVEDLEYVASSEEDNNNDNKNERFSDTNMNSSIINPTSNKRNSNTSNVTQEITNENKNEVEDRNIDKKEEYNEDNELNERRMSKRFTNKKPLSVRIINSYMQVLFTMPFKIVAVAVYIVMIVFSILGFKNLTLGLDQRISVIEGSEIYKYFSAQIDFVDIGPPAYIIFNHVDYENKENLKLIDTIVENISQLSTVIPPVFSWYKDFSKFMTDVNAEWKSVCNPDYDLIKNLPFEIQIKEFLRLASIDSKCCKKYGICGEQYKIDIGFDDEGKLDSTRFRFQHVPLTAQTVYVDCILQTKNLMKKYSDKLTQITGKGGVKPEFKINDETLDIDSTYPYSLIYAYFDQYLVIRGVFLENFIIALAVIFLACQLIVAVLPAFIITLFVFSTVMCLIGVLYILNFFPGYIIEINAVSVVNIVMSCGLSVEFIAHIVMFYLKRNSDDSKDKTDYSMKTVGTSVFVGIITTKFIGKFYYSNILL